MKKERNKTQQLGDKKSGEEKEKRQRSKKRARQKVYDGSFGLLWRRHKPMPSKNKKRG